eukprot:Em0013g321a
MKAICKRLYKDMEQCNEAIEGITKVEQRMLSDVRLNPHGRGDTLKQMIEVIANVVTDLQSHTKSLRVNQDITFIGPMKRFYGVYNHVDFHARQRAAKLSELEKQQAKLEKLEKRPPQSNSQVKVDLAQRAVLTARAEYERIHSRLMYEVPELCEQRVGYYETCLRASIKAQALYYHQCSLTLRAGLVKVRGEGGMATQEELTQLTAKYLDDIKALSIVGNVASS